MALKTILGLLKKDFSVPIIIVQHTGPNAGDYMARYLDSLSALRVKEADEKEKLIPESEPGDEFYADHA